MVILEDDPYWHLQFGSAASPKTLAEYTPPANASYLSMDTDGRVLRFDSFSKILSSGVRVGFITGPKQWVNQLCLTTQATSIHPSGIPQVMVSKLLAQWDQAGWEKHVKETKWFYLQRRDFFLDAVKRHLDGLVEYT